MKMKKKFTQPMRGRKFGGAGREKKQLKFIFFKINFKLEKGSTSSFY